MGKIMLNEIDYSGGNANVIRLTQAEYDALPPSKLTDNNVYMITDVNGDGSQFQPVIYSEDEREVGVWVDGKPLYEITIDCGELPNNTSKNITTPTNIEHLIDAFGCVTDYEGNDRVMPFAGGGSNDIRVDLSNGSLRIVTFATWASYYAFVTVRYTKTTDTAGSGTWTPQGVPAVHYSTDEKVVGTWIDGSTIYEKTFELSNTVATTANSWSTISGINLSGDEDWILQTIVYLNADKSAKVGFGKNDNGVFKYFDTVQLAIDKITIQYTKTSQGGN